jgi:hypothetical protein
MDMQSVTSEDHERLFIPPSAYALTFPTYGQWADYVASFAPHARLINGEVKIECLGCHAWTSPWETAPITIGTRVRLLREEPDPTCTQRTLVKTIIRPMSKKGPGCRECQDALIKKVGQVSKINLLIRACATAEARLHVLNGTTGTLPNEWPEYLEVEGRME